jgi:DNA-binding beta-propeller fold protein YncE
MMVSAAQLEENPSLTAVFDIVWQPQGELLLVSGKSNGDNWGVWLYNVIQHSTEFLFFESPASINWSPDGSQFSAGRRIFDTESLQIIVTLDAASGIGGWSLDGSQVLAWADETFTLLGLFDATTGQLIRTISTGDVPPDAVSWSPDGAYFALVQPTGETNIISAQTGNLVTTVTMEYPIGLRWSPDSQYLTAGFTENVEPDTPGILPLAANPRIAFVVVWNALSGTVVRRYEGFLDVPTIIRWHPSRPELAVGTPLGLVYVFNHQTGERTDMLASLSGLTGMEYSPFGGRVITGANITNQEFLNMQRTALLATTQQLPLPQTLADNVLVYNIPDPTLDRLADIQAACVADAQGMTTLAAPESTPQPDAIAAVESLAAQEVTALTLDALPAYIAQVEALPEGSIPPACAADLIAVAEAVMTEGSAGSE